MEIKLDPELQALVDETAAANPNMPHAVDVPLEILRAGFVRIGQKQSLSDIACEKVEDFQIPSAIPARAYTPLGAGASKLPCLIFIHGGGFMIGDLDSHDSVCRQIASIAGVKVIALDYRLAPEYKFPVAVDDCIAAAQWICANAVDLKLDAARIAIGGDSAGGNLSAVVCNHFAEQGGPKLAFQLLIYPGIDSSLETESRRELSEGVTLDRRIIEYFSEAYLGGIDFDDNDPRLSPAHAASHSKVPSTHIVTAQYDPLRDEGKVYFDILQAAGVPVTYKCYDGLMLMHNFILQTAVVGACCRAVNDMADVLRWALGPRRD